MQYLNEKQYYIDRYDLQTIKECLDYILTIQDKFLQEKDKQFQKYTTEKFNEEIDKVLGRIIFALA